MNLVFFDESKNDLTHPHYHIGGVCIAEKHLSEIEGLVDAIANTAFGSTTLSRETELHAIDIFHRKRNFKDCADFGKRLELFSAFADILSLETVRLIDVQINFEKLYDSQDPAEIAFMYFCERANDLLKVEGSLGMLIGDRENDRVADRYSRTLSGYRADGTDYAYGRDIHNLVDSVHFSHSHLSRFLQLADIYTWFLQFRVRNAQSDNARHKSIFEIFKKDTVNLGPSKYKEWPR